MIRLTDEKLAKGPLKHVGWSQSIMKSQSKHQFRVDRACTDLENGPEDSGPRSYGKIWKEDEDSTGCRASWILPTVPQCPCFSTGGPLFLSRNQDQLSSNFCIHFNGSLNIHMSGILLAAGNIKRNVVCILSKTDHLLGF